MKYFTGLIGRFAKTTAITTIPPQVTETPAPSHGLAPVEGPPEQPSAGDDGPRLHEASATPAIDGD